jgi:hypothetical protein
MKPVKEKITPKKAREWLKRNDTNRPLRRSRVTKLADAMRRGEWKLNGEAIKFNCDGSMADGQHRCEAVVESGVTIESLVVYGIQPDAFDTMDQGISRSIADVFARNGEMYYAVLATAVRWVGVLSDGMNWKATGYSPDQAKDALNKNAGLRDSVKRVSVAAMDSGIFPAAMATALHYLFAQKDAELADKFFHQLLVGEGLLKKDPVYGLRDRLIRNRGDEAKLPRDVIIGYTIKTWNATRAKKPMGVLRWTEGTMPEIK